MLCCVVSLEERPGMLTSLQVPGIPLPGAHRFAASCSCYTKYTMRPGLSVSDAPQGLKSAWILHVVWKEDLLVPLTDQR